MGVFHPVLALGAIVCAVLAWRDAATVIALSDAAARRGADRASARAAPPTTREALRMAAAAKAILRAAPLTPGALYDLALASERSRPRQSGRLLALAEKMSRRDMRTQIALLRLAAQAGDYDAALMRLDHMLQIAPQILPDFEAAMSALAEEPAGRRALARYGARVWFYRFAERAIGANGDLRGLAVLLLETPRIPSSIRSKLASPVLTRLVAAGDYDGARDFAVRFIRVKPATLDDFRLSSRTVTADLRPLSWEFATNAAAGSEARFDPAEGLLAELQPGASAVIAQRVTLLRPGTYLFDQILGPGTGEDGLRLDWGVICEGQSGRAPVWQQRVPLVGARRHYQSHVTVPVGCRAQRWQLHASADEGSAPASVHVEALSLAPA